MIPNSFRTPFDMERSYLVVNTEKGRSLSSLCPHPSGGAAAEASTSPTAPSPGGAPPPAPTARPSRPGPPLQYSRRLTTPAASARRR